MLGEAGDAAAGGHMQDGLFELNRLMFDGEADGFRDAERTGESDTGEEDGHFLTAVTGAEDPIAVADFLGLFSEDLCGPSQDLIAGGVAVVVVDQFETVEMSALKKIMLGRT